MQLPRDAQKIKESVLDFKFVENCLLCLRGSCWTNTVTSEDFLSVIYMIIVLKLHVAIATYCALQ